MVACGRQRNHLNCPFKLFSSRSRSSLTLSRHLWLRASLNDDWLILEGSEVTDDSCAPGVKNYAVHTHMQTHTHTHTHIHIHGRNLPEIAAIAVMFFMHKSLSDTRLVSFIHSFRFTKSVQSLLRKLNIFKKRN